MGLLFQEWYERHQEVLNGGDAPLIAVLLCFVSSLKNRMNNYIFARKILLENEEKLALVPLYFGYLFDRLD